MYVCEWGISQFFSRTYPMGKKWENDPENENFIRCQSVFIFDHRIWKFADIFVILIIFPNPFVKRISWL